ncbi:MAG: nucleotidyltransferase family protein [Chloroflexi bacterium]|nr:nucleotidyltransferase family protein [Chloroflexota bacterium]
MRAIILAGGRGERLMPLTADRPKCLVEVAGTPILGHQLEWLAANGVDEVALSCGPSSAQIREYAADGAEFGLHLTYAIEATPLGRGGGLRFAWGQFQSGKADRDPVVAVNGDLLTGVSLRQMRSAHERSGALATLLLVPLVSQHGLVDVDPDGRILAFREKPALPYFLSGGVYLLSPEVLDMLPRKGDHEVSTWPRLATEGRMHGYRWKGFWRSIDSVKDVSEANLALQRRLRRQ